MPDSHEIDCYTPEVDQSDEEWKSDKSGGVRHRCGMVMTLFAPGLSQEMWNSQMEEMKRDHEKKCGVRLRCSYCGAVNPDDEIEFVTNVIDALNGIDEVTVKNNDYEYAFQEVKALAHGLKRAIEINVAGRKI